MNERTQLVAALTQQGMSSVQIAKTLGMPTRSVRRARQRLGILAPAPDIRHTDDRDGESWLPVVGYEGRYEVSDQGRVRSLPRVNIDTIGRARPFPGQLLIPNITGEPPYPSVNLRHNGKSRISRVHELVLIAFVGPRPADKPYGRHLDDNKLDNRLSNLKWGTPTENAQDALRNGRNYYANLKQCVNGHEFTPENTWHGAKQRICKACHYARKATSA